MAQLQLNMGMYDCTCIECYAGNLEYCIREHKRQAHSRDVSYILLTSHEVMTLLVGQSKRMFTCHKARLGYFSEFFDAACYGLFVEAELETIELPEETVEQISTFIAWVYFGHLQSNLSPQEIWVLADKPRSPSLANEAMYFMLGKYHNRWIDAADVEFVCKNTTEVSKLRSFTRDLIITMGPLSETCVMDEDWIREWYSLIKAGGDLVLEIAQAKFSFSNYSYHTLYDVTAQEEYLLTVTTRPIEDFMAGKKRTGTGNRNHTELGTWSSVEATGSGVEWDLKAENHGIETHSDW